MRKLIVAIGLVAAMSILASPVAAHWFWDHLRTGRKNCGATTIFTRIASTGNHRHVVAGSSKYAWSLFGRYHVSVRSWSVGSGTYELMTDWPLAWTPSGTYAECDDP